MTTQQARDLLAVYRPGVDDDREPGIAAALAMARENAELAQWLEQQRAFDTAMRRAVAEIPVPLGLKTRILANRPARSSGTRWWRMAWPLVLTACALLVVLLGVPALRTDRSPFALYRNDMLAFVAEPYALDVESEDLAEVRAQMARRGYPHDFRLPLALLRYPVEGGCLRTWQGHKVSLVCFGSEVEHAPDVWVFVIPRAAIPELSAGATPTYAPWEDLAAAHWMDGDNLYLAASELKEEDLRKLF